MVRKFLVIILICEVSIFSEKFETIRIKFEGSLELFNNFVLVLHPIIRGVTLALKLCYTSNRNFSLFFHIILVDPVIAVLARSVYKVGCMIKSCILYQLCDGSFTPKSEPIDGLNSRGYGEQITSMPFLLISTIVNRSFFAVAEDMTSFNPTYSIHYF